MNPVRIALLFCVFCRLIPAQQGATISGCPAFPANNVWNAPVDTLPLDAHSADYISNIGPAATLRYDITIPINIVPGTQPKVPLNIQNPDESDPGPFPIPPNAQVEQGSDQHVIVVDKDNCILYETYGSSLNADGSWTVSSSATWSLLSNALRPAGWTSADAAGLPMMPGILRYDEVAAGQVNHALRFTVPHTQRLYIWPARHYASSNTSVLLPPMGQRFRLKASFDISGYSPNVQVILRAMKKYGIIVADNGLPWEMQFVVDSRWNTTELDQLRGIAGSNLEAVDESSLMVDPNSGQAGASAAAVTVSPASKTLGPSQSQQFSATVSGSGLGVVWSMNPSAGALSASGLYTAPASIGSSQNVTVTARLSDGSAAGSAVVTLQPVPVGLASVAVAPVSVVGPGNVSVTVTLTAAAPAAGLAVALTGSNPAFPAANVTVAGGAIFQTFTLPTSAVTTPTLVTITATANGSSVNSSALTVNPAALLPPTGTAAFVKADTTTAGSWKTAYGADGYNVINDTASYPAYAAVNPAGAAAYTWASSTTDLRAAQKGASTTDRIAACWYSMGAFTVDVNLTDGKTHQVAFYMLDWDNYNGRSQKVEVLDANSTVLDTRTVSGFVGGQYLVWNLSGHVVVRVTNLNNASNAVLSGIFFGGAPAAGSSGSAATFIKTDTSTGGTWQGVYGADGYNVINDTAAYPAYVTATPAGAAAYTWASSTTDLRAPQKGASITDRIAACWYSGGVFSVDLKFADTNPHQVAFYMLDWDNYSGRSQRVDVLDFATNAVLDTRTVSGFVGGQYLVWNLSGHVIVRVTNLNAASNAVLSGIFFGGAGAASAPGTTAAFVKTDTSTAGNWKGVYGANGYNVIGDTASYPAFVTATSAAASAYTWTTSTTDMRAPQKAASLDRVASCWFSLTSFTVDLKFNDTGTHQVAFYMVDWDTYGNGRSQRVDILDAATNAVLDTRTVTGFVGGQYLVWNLSGHVTVRITNVNPISNAVLSGIFFGGGTTVTSSSTTPAMTFSR